MKTLYKKILLMNSLILVLNIGYGQPALDQYFWDFRMQFRLTQHSMQHPEYPENSAEELDSMKSLSMYSGTYNVRTFKHDSLGRVTYDSDYGIHTYPSKNTYYDSEGKKISEITYTDETKKLSGATKIDYEYDLSGNIIKWIFYNYSDETKTWIKTGFNNYSYNSDNILIDTESYFLDSVSNEFNLSNKTQFIHENGKFKNRILFSIDSVTGSMDTSELVNMNYDSLGRYTLMEAILFSLQDDGSIIKYQNSYVIFYNDDENGIGSYQITTNDQGTDTSVVSYTSYENSDYTGYNISYGWNSENKTLIKYAKYDYRYEYDKNNNIIAVKVLYTNLNDITYENYGKTDTTSKYYYEYDEKNRLYRSTRYSYSHNTELFSLKDEKFYYYRPDPAAIKIETQSETAIAVTFNRYIKPNENLVDLIDITPVNLVEDIGELQIISATVNPKDSRQIIIVFDRSLEPAEKYTIASNTELDTYDNNIVTFSFEASGFKSSVTVNEISENELSISQSNDMIVLSSPIAIKQVEILSVSGSKLASSVEKESNTVSVNTSGMAAGVYLFAVRYSDGNSETVKVVVK